MLINPRKLKANPNLMSSQTSPTNQIKIISWNIEGGITNKKARIQSIIHDHKANILLLQDTRQKNDYEIAKKWYKVYGHCQDIPHPSGGVLTAIDLNMVHREEFSDSNKNIKVTRITEPITFTLINVYLQPSSWDDNFQELETIINQIRTPVVISGDFNAHHQQWFGSHNNSRGIRIVDFCDRHNLNIKDLNKPTHIDRRNDTATHIDLTLISPRIDHLFHWDTDIETHGSDHYPIILTLEANQQYERIQSWNYNKADWISFNQNLSLQIPENITSIDAKVEWTTKQIIEASTTSIPRKSHTFKFPVPWWNEECTKARREKRRLERIMWRRCGDQLAVENFNKATKHYQNTIANAKNTSWISYISTLKEGTPSKLVWDRVMAVAGRKNRQPIKPIYTNGETFETKKEIADYIAEKIQHQSSNEKATNAFKVYRAIEDQKLYNFEGQDQTEKPITWYEFENTLKRCGLSAMGPDEINYLMLKKMDKTHQEKIYDLFKTIWNHGQYPTPWKTADIVPLTKPGKDLTDPRPISLTNCMARIFDKLVNTRLQYELERIQAIPIEQAAFRITRSTLDPCVALESEIRHALANKKITSCVFIDIEKAYDSVYPGTVLQELMRLRLKGKIPNIIQSFMSGRKARVKLVDVKSKEISLDLGIPQGSSLSCTLFSIAMNSVIREIKCCKALLYVDDLVIFHTSESIQKNINMLQEAMNAINTWSNKTNLRISGTKTKVLHFHRLRNIISPKPQILMQGTNIEEVTKFKYLGILFDKTLTWRKHITTIAAKQEDVSTCLKFSPTENLVPIRK